MENVLALKEKQPVDVLERGKISAKLLMQVIESKKKPVRIQGETYLEYEDWQLINEFDGRGYTVRTRDAIPIEIEGVKGAKAEAELIDPDSKIVGGAEAYCMRDEPNWREKPWFQLASMAQTRAGAKALRNKFSFICPLAGVKSTPAEEMQEHNGEQKAEGSEAKHKEESPPHSPFKNVISLAQAKRFYAIGKATGASDQDIKDWLAREYNLHSTKDIPIDLYEEICKRVKDELSTPGSEG